MCSHKNLYNAAKRHDLPLILHSRKAEQRLFDMLLEEGVTKADFHCFGGKVCYYTPLLVLASETG